MICQTLCACVINLDKHGEAFSIRDPNVFAAGQCVCEQWKGVRRLGERRIFR